MTQSKIVLDEDEPSQSDFSDDIKNQIQKAIEELESSYERLKEALATMMSIRTENIELIGPIIYHDDDMSPGMMQVAEYISRLLRKIYELLEE